MDSPQNYLNQAAVGLHQDHGYRPYRKPVTGYAVLDFLKALEAETSMAPVPLSLAYRLARHEIEAFIAKETA